MDSAPIFTASLTFSSSISRSLQSRDVPKFTLIFVFSIEPMPLGTRHLWFLLAGMATFPWATSSLSFSGSNCSFSATFFSSSVRIPFLAASICVVYSIISSFFREMCRPAAASVLNAKNPRPAGHGFISQKMRSIFPYVGITQIRYKRSKFDYFLSACITSSLLWLA